MRLPLFVAELGEPRSRFNLNLFEPRYMRMARESPSQIGYVNNSAVWEGSSGHLVNVKSLRQINGSIQLKGQVSHPFTVVSLETSDDGLIVAEVVAEVGTSSTTTEVGNNLHRKIISQTISIGAPAYNQGKIRECADLYTEALGKLIEMTSCVRIEEIASNGLKKAQSMRDDNKRAWQLRHILDELMGIDAVQARVPQAQEASQGEIFMFDSSAGKELVQRFRSINDTVMGGSSSSSLRILNSESCFFFGGMLPLASRCYHRCMLGSFPPLYSRAQWTQSVLVS